MLRIAPSALLALVAACGGDDELKDALESVSEHDLTIMVLPQEELGEVASDLDVSADDSGFISHEAAADNSIHPDDTADDLAARGRVAGYALSYRDSDFFAVLEAGEGLIIVGTTVHLWLDSGAAEADIEKTLNDFRRFDGEEVEGARYEGLEEFAISGLGDESGGLRFQVEVVRLGVKLYVTSVYFRIDRVIGVASAARADDESMSAQTEEIARKLADRIRGVLLNEVTGTPVPVPPAEDDEPSGTAPQGAPDLAAMALALDDLPAGVEVDHEGYVEGGNAVAEFEREFDLRGKPIGTSRLISLESAIDLFATAFDATAKVRAFETLFVGERGADLFASIIQGRGGFAVTNVQIEVEPLALGDEGLLLRAAADVSGLGRVIFAFLVVRVDRVVGRVMVTAAADSFNVDDIVPLAEAMTLRMESSRISGQLSDD